ncbi:MerR family DNA-binding transcriptional regulator [Agathobaculum sp. Marseille-P7918]|uniref:MerR family DNA-binding transcriptional regulator n=1 Tax=Agathobaculum sp. Marseille-P7918 TaxID=2479843 RepID=UPI000F63434C|nr:MerR family DNA-binding transcriptional regulator [Agathobaculum sp. Marseille-P7918]
MQGFLSIGDFAKLRNVNPKSLRYYERIGALIPAYIDPETGYRYYALEQLVEMDMILMCLELDIPLRNAEQYRQSDQTLDIRRLLEDGQQKAHEKLAHLRNTMQQMEEALRRIEENKRYQEQEGVYRRHLRQRLILRQPFTPSGGELAFKQSSTEIFLRGQSLGLLPAFTFPIGLIAQRQGDRTDTDIFLEVLQQEDGITNLDVLPEGNYLCQQRPAQALEHVDALITEYFVQHPEANQVIITNLTSAFFDLKGPLLELQQPI